GSGETANGAPQRPKKAKRAAKRKPARAGKGKRAKGSEKLAVTRAGSKKATVLDLLQRKNGATLAEIRQAKRCMYSESRIRSFPLNRSPGSPLLARNPYRLNAAITRFFNPV